MTLCPVAMAVGCRKCAAVNFCPLKSIIGDFKAEEAAQADKPADSNDKRAG